MKKSGTKWKTDKCGRCGESHSGYSGKIDSEGCEYIVCGNTNKKIIVNGTGDIRDIFVGIWEIDI